MGKRNYSTYPNNRKPPETKRKCLVCERNTLWEYDKIIGHSRCKECGCYNKLKI